jgi:hypothetical protein
VLAISTEEDYYEDDEEDDPDALKDPLYQIDLQVRVSREVLQVTVASHRRAGMWAEICS